MECRTLRESEPNGFQVIPDPTNTYKIQSHLPYQRTGGKSDSLNTVLLFSLWRLKSFRLPAHDFVVRTKAEKNSFTFYYHVVLCEHSSTLTTFDIPDGRYRWKFYALLQRCRERGIEESWNKNKVKYKQTNTTSAWPRDQQWPEA